ncbi:MAG: hypothetical protein QOD74_363, partial [Variibacter sp.]|nr:hypothetical protein [Variibacter sp.]
MHEAKIERRGGNSPVASLTMEQVVRASDTILDLLPVAT